MGDLIDRQEAIDAVAFGIIYEKAFDKEAVKVKVIERCCEGNYELKNAIDRIKELPSAQPEIVRCKDCKWYGRADKRRFYRGMDCLNHRIATIVPDKDYCSRAERRTDANN